MAKPADKVMSRLGVTEDGCDGCGDSERLRDLGEETRGKLGERS